MKPLIHTSYGPVRGVTDETSGAPADDSLPAWKCAAEAPGEVLHFSAASVTMKPMTELQEG